MGNPTLKLSRELFCTPHQIDGLKMVVFFHKAKCGLGEYFRCRALATRAAVGTYQTSLVVAVRLVARLSNNPGVSSALSERDAEHLCQACCWCVHSSHGHMQGCIRAPRDVPKVHGGGGGWLFSDGASVAAHDEGRLCQGGSKVRNLTWAAPSCERAG